MKKITLISDTHSQVMEDVIPFLKQADEVWHAGDLGVMDTLLTLEKHCKKLVGVYGNIDDAKVRACWPLNQVFECEGLKVLMTHIGGYTGRYTNRVKGLIKKEKPQLYICGHSHILKVMRDQKNEVLHMNPGACGHIGFHKFRTLLTFEIHDGKIDNLQAVELGVRGIYKPDQQI